MRIVLGVIGAVISTYAGAGPMIGFSIGYAIGGAIDSSNQKIVTEGPRLSDVRMTVSEAGKFIIRVYVRGGNIGGNIIDTTDLISAEHTVELSSDGKGGPTAVQKTTTYSASFLVLVCKSDGDRDIVTIKANGVPIWSRSPNADAGTLLATAGLVGQIIVYDGNDDQLPDPTLEALHGVGNVPAYLGCLTVMFVDFQLANYSNNIEATQLTFEVVQNGSNALTDHFLNELPHGRAAVLDKREYWVFGRVNDQGATPVYRDLFDGAGLQYEGLWQSIDKPVDFLFVKTPAGYNGLPCATYEQRPANAVYFDDVSVGSPAAVYRIGDSYRIDFHTFPIYRDGPPPLEQIGECTSQDLVATAYGSVTFYTPAGAVLARLTRLADGDHTLRDWRTRFPDSSPDAGNTKTIGANSATSFLFCQTVGTHSWICGKSTNGGGEFVFDDTNLPTGRVCGMTVADDFGYVLFETAFDVTLGSRYDAFKIDMKTGTILQTLTGPRYAPGFTVNRFDLFLLSGVLNVVVGALCWSWSDAGDLAVKSLAAPSTGTHGALQRVHEWTSDDFLITSFNRGVEPYNTTLSLYLTNKTVDVDGVPLRQVLTDIANDKPDSPLLDFSGLPDTVIQEGYVVTRQTSRRVAMDYLLDLYRVDSVESADKIKFVLRGGPIARTFTIPDLGAFDGSGDPPQAVEFLTADELGLPAQVVLRYTDRDNNFEVGTVIAKRETTTSTNVITLDCTAVMMTGTEAIRFCEMALQDARVASDTYTFATLYTHEDLEPTDVVSLPGKRKNHRVRIKKKTDKAGMIGWEGVRDDPNSIKQFVIGGGATGTPGLNSGSIGSIPVTLAELLNLPLLRNEDDDAGFYVFVYPRSPDGFRGADVYDQATTAPNKIGSVPSVPGARGVAISVLPDYTGFASFDTASQLDVQFPAGTSLLSATSDRVLAGDNAFAVIASDGRVEIIGVRTTTDLGSGLWRLHGGILRGLRGTEAAISTHVASERVYQLTTTSLRRDRTASTSGTAQTTATVAAVSVGRPLTDLRAFASTGTNTQRALQPLDPINLAYGEDGDGGLVFRWDRRTRLLFPFGTTPPLGEDVEAYRLDFSATADFATVTAFYPTTQDFHLTRQQRLGLPAPFFCRVLQIGSGDGSVPLITPPTVNDAPSGVMPPDTLPLTVLNVDASSVPDGGSVVDSSASPSAVLQTAPVQDGRVTFADAYTGLLSISDDPKFNFGSRDFSIEINVTIRARIGPYGLLSEGSQVLNHGPSQGISPGQIQVFFNLSERGPGYPGGGNGQTADSGTVSFYSADFGGPSGSVLVRSRPGMNDGMPHTYRFARSGGGVYLSVDGVLVDSTAISGPFEDIFAVPLTIGRFRGSMGRITIKTST